MAKTTAPLLSFSADGQIAKTMVYSKWRGIKYARRHVVPANPNTAAQQTVRSTFALMREMWKIAPQLARAPWDAFATGRPFLGLNKFIGENVRVLNGQADFTNFIGSPGARGGLPPDSVAITPGALSGEIDVDTTNPAAPPGWTLSAMQAMAFPDQSPSGIFSGIISADEDTVTFNTLTFTGLTASATYAVAAWLQWTKPDGALAYSVGTTDLVAATA